ncbi:helix-turn-helix domain-containing protein [Nocardia australiensis]|uniref:helix-turn-helix domain-containing protein n=1 Tax=Nocardia australiensis TaxID=2887191 RepID=UPI001D14248E|nr:helix-turn-helix transcriptional regulator [Nocardia australiensis]
MRAALSTRNMAAVLSAYRHNPAHGSRAIPQTETARWLGITQGQLSRIENGRSRINDLDKLAHYARVLAIPPSLLWFEMENDSTSRQTTEMPQLSDGRPVSAAGPASDSILADSLLTNLAQYVRTDMVIGPRALLPVVAEQIRFIEELHDTSHGRTRDKFRAVHARFAEFLGWLNQDAGNLRAAIECSNVAYALARELGDDRLRSYFLMRQSNLADDVGTGRSTLNVAEAALRLAQPSTPRLRALALRQRARSHARSGQPDECARALDLAYEYAATASGDDTDLAAYCTPEYIAMEAADCWVQLNRPERAIARLEAGLARWKPENRRDLGRGLAVLARARARTDQPDQALDAARHALAIATETGSVRTEIQVRQAAAELASTGASEHFAELRSALRTMVP